MGELRASVENLMADGALSQQQNKNPCEKNEKAKIEKTFNHSLTFPRANYVQEILH